MADTKQTIGVLSNTTNYDGLLKDVYLPGLTDTIFNDPSFTALIQATTDNIDYEGQRIKHTFKTQRAGGHGTIAEGGNFVTSVPSKGQQGWEQIKYLNAYFEITGPAIRVAASGRGSFENTATQAFEDMITNTQNDMERMLQGDGTAKLATIATAEVGNTYVTELTVTADSGAYFGTQFLRQGMFVDVYESAGTSPIVNNAQVSAVTAETVTLIQGVTDPAGNAASTTAEMTSETVTAADYITQAGNGYAASNSEIHGIKNLVSTGRTIWNLADSSYPFLLSEVQSAVGEELDESLLLGWLLDMKFKRQSQPNIIVTSPKIVLSYFNNIKDDRRFNTMSAMEWVGGYTGMGVQLGNTKLMLTDIGSCPEDYLYMLNINEFAFATMSNGYEWLGDGRVLTQKEGSDNKFATAINYLQFVCYNPYTQFKATGIEV